MTAAIALLAAAIAPAAFSPQDPSPAASAQALVVRGETVYTMAGEPIRDGVVVVRGGKIVSVGQLAQLPEGVPVLQAKVVTPGLIDAHATVGLSGVLNVPHDQDQLEASDPVQPELRAIDAYHARDPLVAWVRSLGVTAVHTGHGPGALISGQTMVVKTHGRSADEDVVVPLAMVAVTLGDGGRNQDGKSPGTRAKSVAMLREELQRARDYAAKRDRDADASTDLGLEVLGRVLAGDVPLLVTAHRAHDLASALRVAEEFGVRVVLDGAAEAYLMLPTLAEKGAWVLPHPPMARTRGELKNGTMELAKLLFDAKVPFALQSGFESYVPKTRVVLWEAAIAVQHGLPADAALRALTLDAARLCGVEARLGSRATGKDADLALFDGDPFEYTTHCVGVVVDGVPYVGSPR